MSKLPLTTYLIVAAIILYLYIRRANLGIDLHPGEKAAAPVQAPQPRVFIGPIQPPTAPSFQNETLPGLVLPPDRASGGILQ